MAIFKVNQCVLVWLYLLILFIIMCVSKVGWMLMYHRKLSGVVSFLCLVGSRDQTQVTRFDSKHFNLFSHLTNSSFMTYYILICGVDTVH